MSEQSNGSLSPRIALLLTTIPVAAIIGVLASIPGEAGPSYGSGRDFNCDPYPAGVATTNP